MVRRVRVAGLLRTETPAQRPDELITTRSLSAARCDTKVGEPYLYVCAARVRRVRTAESDPCLLGFAQYLLSTRQLDTEAVIGGVPKKRLGQDHSRPPVTSGPEKGRALGRDVGHRARLFTGRHRHLRERLLVASPGREKFRERTMNRGGRSQFERRLELPFRALPIPLEGA